MAIFKDTHDERPPATGSKVPVWIEDAEGRVVEGFYAESLCDAGADVTGYWYDKDGLPVPSPARWMSRKEQLPGTVKP